MIMMKIIDAAFMKKRDLAKSLKFQSTKTKTLLLKQREAFQIQRPVN